MYIKRDIEDKIAKYIHTPEILAIVGPRQSGKTTLISHIYSNYKEKSNFLTFEDPETLSMFERDTLDFINLYVKNKSILFIDEFQYAKNGGKILKRIYDEFKIKIIITGSSSVDLTVQALKSLVGRIFIFEIFPFNFEEFLRAKDLELCDFYREYVKKGLEDLLAENSLNFGDEMNNKLRSYFQEYSIYGGYPRVVLSSDTDEKKEILKGIYSTFFLREVKDYMGLIDDYKLQKLVKSLSLQIGSLIDYKELSSLSGYAFVSLKKYLNFLEKTYICSLVRPFFRNKRKEIVKNPKVYFLDAGLRNYIVNDFRKLDERPDSGELLENNIFVNLRKKGYEIKYWRSKTKREIDFIVEKDGLTIGIEVKMNVHKCRKSPSETEFSQLYPDSRLIFLYYKGFSREVKDPNGFCRFPSYAV